MAYITGYGGAQSVMRCFVSQTVDAVSEVVCVSDSILEIGAI